MVLSEKLKNQLKTVPFIDIYVYLLKYQLPCILMGDRKYVEREIKKKFKETFGYEIDLSNPQTLNEKIQWLKLNIHEDFHTICADKLAVRDYWAAFGKEGLIPLLYHTENWRDIVPDNIPDEPCIVKCNTGCGLNQIIRDKKTVDFTKLRKKCKSWLKKNYYYSSQEWQYKNIRSCILVEKLLLDSKGHIPNDYKLHFINGELQFIYCSIDREGENYRSIYSPEWTRMDFEWVPKNNHKGMKGKEIPAPLTFEKMKEIGLKVAERFKYVRVDFYETEGKLYYGEITIHHGSGFDTFVPEYYDMEYGKKLDLGI